MFIEATIKKWGNSFGVILPKEELERKHFKVNDTLVLNIVKKGDLQDIFGKLKNSKISGQEFKNMVREGWN